LLVSLLQAFALFCAGCGVLAFWVDQGQGDRFALAAAALTVCCGWPAKVVWANNLDNGLALVYMPTLACLLRAAAATPYRAALLAGGAAAALAYTYVECAALVLLGSAVVALPGLPAARPAWGTWARAGGVLVLTAACLLAPARHSLLRFGRDVADGVRREAPPGQGLFKHLLTPAEAPAAAFGLGAAYVEAPSPAAGYAYAAGLSALLALGLAVSLRRRSWGLPAALALFASGGLYLLLGRRYDYGAYKFLNLSWWLVAGLVCLGAARALRAAGRPPWRWALAAGLALAGAHLARLSPVGAPLWPSRNYGMRLSDPRVLRALHERTGGQPYLLVVEDWLANVLALYHLRDTNCVPVFHGYYDFVPRFNLPKPALPARHVLSDLAAPTLDGGRVVGAFGPYSLWELERPAADCQLFRVEAPFGLEQTKPHLWFWSGPQETAAYAYATRRGVLELACSLFPGPCAPHRDRVGYRVTTDAGYDREFTVPAGSRAVAVPVHEGLNRFTLRPTDPPLLAHAPNGDVRCLLLAVIVHSTRFRAPGEGRTPSPSGR
jgi:hypothetical protein